MNKSELASRVASRASLSRADADRAVNAMLSAIGDALATGETVRITGFGRFTRAERPAREGRNPRTGERIAIGPSSGVSFKAAKALKEALN